MDGAFQCPNAAIAQACLVQRKDLYVISFNNVCTNACANKVHNDEKKYQWLKTLVEEVFGGKKGLTSNQISEQVLFSFQLQYTFS